ncbi:MAG: shikimate kinase [Phototrophicales bacterium]|nr:MAG: shikimate kinase [Phototrophicales bacterium]
MWSGVLAIPEPTHPIPASARSLVLTGFMGTGKTTIGRRVSALTGRPFVDTDDEIVRKAGKSIPTIFRDDGEAAFRALEQRVCKALAHVPGLVIATGGGMLVNAENRALMMEAALVVCLEAPPEVIETRLRANADRPLAVNWRELLAARQPAYAEIPTHIDTGSKTIDEVAEELIERWRASL